MIPKKTITMDDEDAFAQRSFNLRNSEHAALRRIARKLKIYWAGQPSVGKMLKMIAKGELKVS